MNQNETETKFDPFVRPEDFAAFMALMTQHLEEEVLSKMGLINQLNKILQNATETTTGQ